MGSLDKYMDSAYDSIQKRNANINSDFYAKYGDVSKNTSSSKSIFDSKVYSDELDRVVAEKKKNMAFDKDAYWAQKNQETIDGLKSNLSSNGIETPEMLDTGKKWYEKIFDPISAAQYGVARGVRNLVDENASTGFFQGVKEGVQAGFDNKGEHRDNRTSWKEVLDTLLSSSNAGVRNTTAIANNVINPFAWKDAIGAIGDSRNAVDVAKEHTGFTGFLGDAILDPVNLVGGLGAATKVVTKGSKITKNTGSVLDAYKALDALGLEKGLKESRALVEKASKIAGQMPDFQGIYLGTKGHNINLVSADAVKNFADSSIGKMLGGTLNTVVKPVEKVRDYIKNSAVGKGVSELFGGGQYASVNKLSKEHPEDAIYNTAYLDFVKRRKNLKGMAADEIAGKAKELQKQVGEGNNDVLSGLQRKDVPVMEGNGFKETDVKNPSFDTELEHHWSNLAIQKDDIEKQIYDINQKSKGLDIDAVKQVQKLREQLQLLDEMPNVEGVTFEKNIEKSGIDLSQFDMKRMNQFSSILQNPLGVRNLSIEQLTEHLKELKAKQAVKADDNDLENLAVMLKGAADNTWNQIQTDLPELAPYYTGTSARDGVDVLKNGYVNNVDNVVDNTASSYGLNFSRTDTADMTVGELEALRGTLDSKVKQYASEGKTKLLEKAQADLDSVNKQFADMKNAKKANTPYISKESPVGLESDFERINKIKELPDVLVKKALGREDIGELTKEEIANLENVKFHYDNLMSKGFYPEAIQKMGVGSIINRSNEFLKPDLGRALNLIPTPTKNGMNEETYRQVRKSVEEVLKNGKNPYNNKRMVNAKDYEDFVNEFVRKNNILGLDGIGNQEKFLDEGGTLSKKGVHTDKEITDTRFDNNKFDSIKEQEKQKTVYGEKRKLVDVGNPGVKRTIEEIQKYIPDFDSTSAGRMTQIDLNNLMNGLRRGSIDPEKLKIQNILDDISGNANSNPLKKVGKDIYKNMDFSNVPKGSREFLEFDTPNGKVAIDSEAKLKAMQKLQDIVVNRPEEFKGAQQNVNTTLMNGEIGNIIHENGSFKVGGMYKNDAGKNIIMSDGGNTMGIGAKSFEGTLNHETAHSFGNNAWHADRTAASIRRDIGTWTPEQASRAEKLFASVNRKLGKEKGSITTYIDTLKGAKASTATMNRETMAELGSVFLHSDPAIRKEANELFPEGSKMMNDLVAKLPKKDLEKLVPKGASAKEEILSKLDAYNTIAKQIDGIKPEDLVNKTQLEEKFGNIDRQLADSEYHKEAFKKEYADIPEFIKASEPQYKEVDRISSFDMAGLNEEQKKAAEFIRNEFKRFGVEEELPKELVDDLYSYFPRVLNWDLRDKPKYQTIFDDLHNPVNQNAKNREFMPGKSIEEVNKFMKEKHNIDNFFETNVVRAYVDRALNHDEFMFKKDITEKSMNLFGKQIDKGAYEGLSPEAKTKLYDEVQEMFKSGEYDVVRLDDKFVQSEASVISPEALKKAKDNVSAFNPYVKLDPKDIDLQKIFELKDQPIYLVKKDTHSMLKDIAVGQFRQSANGLLKAIDKFNSLWKTNALFSMGFNFNNMMGNTFNNYLAVGSKVLDPKINAAAMAIDFENPKGSFMGKSNKEWRKIAQEFGALGHDFNSEIQDFRKGVTESIGQSPIKKLVGGLNPVGQNFIPYRGARFFSGKIESQARLVNFLANVQSGMTYQQAADNVNKFLFDYSDLTDFEQGTMKRLVPFYTWMRKNFPLQVENLFKQPEKYGKIYRGQQAVSKPETDEQRALRPDYLDSAIHIGNGKYINLNLPYNDLNKMVSPKDLFSSINPVLKTAIEVGTNKNVYYDSPIARQEGATVDAPLYMNPIAKDTPDGKKVDAKLRYILKNLLPSVEQASNAITVARGEGTTANEEKATGWMQGARTYTVDADKAKEQAIRDYIAKLQGIEANAKSEGRLSKTAEQIANEKKNAEQYQKIKDIYEKEYQKRQDIYQNNYVIKKKK